MRSAFFISLLSIVFLGGCDVQTPKTEGPLGYGPHATTLRYTEPSASGLKAVRPYPNPDDVCQVIGKNRVTADIMADGQTLIACPKHEQGAIADRKREGATLVAHAKHWTLLQVSQ